MPGKLSAIIRNRIFLLLPALLCVSVMNLFSQKIKVLAPTPPMGWNSWNWFGKNGINEDIVIEVIDAMVTSGLRDAGYNYIVIDGGWRDRQLGPHGELLPHPGKFPNGIKRLADYAHAHNMKLGLHTVPGTADCIGDPVGGYGHEEIQISQFIDWGIDLVKLDLCRFEGDWSEETIRNVYFKWRMLLDEKSPKGIMLSVSAYKWRDWYPEIAQMARTTDDISAKVGGMSGNNAVFDGVIPQETNKWGLLTVMQVADENNRWAGKAGKGYWNDPDMLVVGDHGLTLNEQKAHFALWCIMSAPLFLGNDPSNMNPYERDMLMNKEALSINQDPSGQGCRIVQDSDGEVWVKKLKDRKTAIVMLNRNSSSGTMIKFDFKALDDKMIYNVRDVFTHKDLGRYEYKIEMTLAPHSCSFLILSDE